MAGATIHTRIVNQLIARQPLLSSKGTSTRIGVSNRRSTLRTVAMAAETSSLDKNTPDSTWKEVLGTEEVRELLDGMRVSWRWVRCS